MGPLPVLNWRFAPRLAPRDAQMLWLSERVHNDQYLLFAFDGATDRVDVRKGLLERRARVPDLGLRVHSVPRDLDYPYWESRNVGDDQLVEHELSASTWAHFTAALAELTAVPLDCTVSPWLLHLFYDVDFYDVDAPACEGRALIVVLQVSHALADGRRASTIARALFGTDELPVRERHRSAPPAPIAAGLGAVRWPVSAVRTVLRGAKAFRAHREFVRTVDVPGRSGQQLAAVNTDPGPARNVRMIVLPSACLRVPDVTVTVAALTAISVAMAAYLATPQRLGAEVTVALERETSARNNFRNVGVDLHIDEPDLRARARAIAVSLDERRQLNRHPVWHTQSAVTAALPASMLRAQIAQYPFDVVPATMSGNTVVSSVHRGPADLRLGGGQVRFTSGFPSLSPFMALTHGVHGIGDTVTVSIVAGMRAVPDIDRYEALLRTALADVARALGGAEFSGVSASIPSRG